MTDSTKPPALTRVQLHALIAISRGQVSTPGPGIDYDLGTWRIDGHRGRAVTVPTEALIRKGYARSSTDVVDDRRYAEPTAAGHEAISRAGARGR
jgi:hypothetical protein